MIIKNVDKEFRRQTKFYICEMKIYLNNNERRTKELKKSII